MSAGRVRDGLPQPNRRRMSVPRGGEGGVATAAPTALVSLHDRSDWHASEGLVIELDLAEGIESLPIEAVQVTAYRTVQETSTARSQPVGSSAGSHRSRRRFLLVRGRAFGRGGGGRSSRTSHGPPPVDGDAWLVVDGRWSSRPTSMRTRTRCGVRPGALPTYSRGSRRTRAPVVVSAIMAPAASWPSSCSMHSTRSRTRSVGR